MQPTKMQHRDASGRLSRVAEPNREQYLRPSDGRLTPLAVQGTEASLELSITQRSDGRNWSYIGRQKSRISFTMRFVCWMYSLHLKSKRAEAEGLPGDGSDFTLALIWIPCCILLAIMVSVGIWRKAKLVLTIYSSSYRRISKVISETTAIMIPSAIGIGATRSRPETDMRWRIGLMFPEKK